MSRTASSINSVLRSDMTFSPVLMVVPGMSRFAWNRVPENPVVVLGKYATTFQFSINSFIWGSVSLLVWLLPSFNIFGSRATFLNVYSLFSLFGWRNSGSSSSSFRNASATICVRLISSSSATEGSLLWFCDMVSLLAWVE